jgi:hypothetical protein
MKGYITQVLKPLQVPTVLAPGARKINLNKQILPLYLETILPGITQPGDDGHYGSSAMLDVLALQVLYASCSGRLTPPCAQAQPRVDAMTAFSPSFLRSCKSAH